MADLAALKRALAPGKVPFPTVGGTAVVLTRVQGALVGLVKCVEELEERIKQLESNDKAPRVSGSPYDASKKRT